MKEDFYKASEEKYAYFRTMGINYYLLSDFALVWGTQTSRVGP